MRFLHFHVIYTFAYCSTVKYVSLSRLNLARKIELNYGWRLITLTPFESESGKMNKDFFSQAGLLLLNLLTRFIADQSARSDERRIYIKNPKMNIDGIPPTAKRVQIKSHNLLLGSALKTRLINVS